MTYLPPNFHYYGMSKIKAGKGYRQDGHPVGPEAGICNECGGTIIALKMNTSSRGFETTSEKVCQTCGLTVPGAFQKLEAQPPYKPIYENSYEEWLTKFKPQLNMDDTDSYMENGVHLYGSRPNTSDNVWYGQAYSYNNILSDDDRLGTESSKRLRKAIARLKKTNASKNVPRDITRMNNYFEIVYEHGRELGLMKYQVADIKWILKHYPNILKIDKKAEDIILCICLYVKSLSMKPQKFSVFIREYKRYNTYNKRLYQLIRETLSI